MLNETISVIIPVYNAEPYIVQCLDSVLNQTQPPDEIVVINDGSTDATLGILQSYGQRIRLVSQENQGLSQTLNNGVGLSTGSLLAFIDNDDFWTLDKLARQVVFLQARPTVEACFGYVQQFISPELPAEVRVGIACPAEPQPGWHKGTMLIRRAAFDRIGGFDPATHLDFVEWLVRARAADLRCAMLPDVVMHRRLRRDGLASRPGYNQELLRLLKAKLDQRKLVQ